MVYDEQYIEWQRMTTTGTTSDNEWQRVTTSGTANDNEWQQVVQQMTASDNRRDIKWREVTTSGNFGQTSFFQIIWCWYKPLFISLRQRLLQAVVIDVLKIQNVNLSKSIIVVFLKLSTSYLLFIIKMCFFFFDEKQMFRFILQKDAHS